MAMTKVVVTTEMWPTASSTWEVEMPSTDPAASLVYNNLVYDLIAVVVGKLGIEYSKLVADDDRARFDTEMERVMGAINNYGARDGKKG